MALQRAVAEAVGLHLPPARVVRAGVELDDEPRRGVPAVDQDAVDADVAPIRVRHAVEVAVVHPAALHREACLRVLAVDEPVRAACALAAGEPRGRGLEALLGSAGSSSATARSWS